MARFEEYEDHKAWWFVTYLRLAEAICAYPALSARNSDFLEYFKAHDEKIDRLERRISGITNDQK